MHFEKVEKRFLRLKYILTESKDLKYIESEIASFQNLLSIFKNHLKQENEFKEKNVSRETIRF